MKKKISFWLAITLVVISTAAFAFWIVYEYSTELPDNVSGVPVITDRNQSREYLAKTDNASGWKTYRNDEYGFEFQYPDAFVQLADDAYNGKGVCLYEGAGDGAYPYFCVRKEKNVERLSVEQWWKNSGNIGQKVNSRYINNYKAEVYKPSTNDFPSGPTLMISKDNYFYIIDYNSAYGDQILSTFKFTDDFETAENVILKAAVDLKNCDKNAAIRYFEFSEKNADLFASMDCKTMSEMANWLGNARLKSDNNEYKVFVAEYANDEGKKQNAEFIVTRKSDGNWIISGI